MTDLPPARAVLRPPLPRPPHDRVTLPHDERTLRRRRLETVDGSGFLVDLPALASLIGGEAFELADGRLIAVEAAAEPLMEVTAASGDLPRLAWHVGNRHAPAQIEPRRLLLRRDHVLRAMLEQLGASVRDVSEPFHPEGGAYAHAHDGLGALAHD